MAATIRAALCVPDVFSTDPVRPGMAVYIYIINAVRRGRGRKKTKTNYRARKVSGAIDRNVIISDTFRGRGLRADLWRSGGRAITAPNNVRTRVLREPNHANTRAGRRPDRR